VINGCAIYLVVRPENDCLDELAIIAAMLSVEEIFHFPKRRGGGGGKSSRHQQEDEDERNAVTFAHDRLRHLKGDHFTYLKIFKKFESEGMCFIDLLV
jgi:HrpA-like RNA helicase